MRAHLNRATERGESVAAPAAPPPIACGFEPIGDRGARVLVLGSLPGRVSLARGEYYAQSQNAFWPIMGCVYGAAPSSTYAERCELLIRHRVALWDVCASARRRGSLDASIDRDSVVINDFTSYFAAHPGVERILFNGAAAFTLYERRVLPKLAGQAAALERLRLPSTSPANASISYDRKLAAWRSSLARSVER